MRRRRGGGGGGGVGALDVKGLNGDGFVVLLDFEGKAWREAVGIETDYTVSIWFQVGGGFPFEMSRAFLVC